MANEEFAGLELITPREQTEPTINGLIFGDSDVGKTRFLGSASLIERFSPVLHLDTEKGYDTLDELPEDADIKILRISRWSQIQAVYRELFERKNKGTLEYKTVNIDNGTYAQNLGILKLLGVEDGVFDTAKLAQFQDYNGSQQQMLRMVRSFRDLEINFFMSAHAEGVKMPGPVEKFKQFPAFTNKLMKQMPGMFGQVFYMAKEEKKDAKTVRTMQTVSSAQVTAKCRRIQLPEVIESPTMQMIADAPLKEIA